MSIACSAAKREARSTKGALEMQQPVKERVSKLREEIAAIRHANKLYMQGAKSYVGAADHERRLERLQEILDELISLTDWKKP